MAGGDDRRPRWRRFVHLPTSPRWRGLVRENWYRDVWLVATSIVVAIGIFRMGDVLDAVDDNRAQSISISCTGDIAQDDVLRAILLASIAQRRDREGDAAADEVRALAERLMVPLGGLEPTPAQRAERCTRRLDTLRQQIDLRGG